MAKRRATTELNRDNWDAEEEEERDDLTGPFPVASPEGLQNRIIKKAKRSNLNTQSFDNAISPFAAFGGFAKSTSSTNPFNFLKNNVEDSNSITASPNKDDKKENGSSTISERKVTPKESTKSNAGKVVAKATTDSSTSHKPKQTRSIEYYRQLQSLNESVMEWMSKHLSKNSCCDFTPVFNDYKKHLDTLNLTYPIKSKEISQEESNSSEASSLRSENPFPKDADHNADHDFALVKNLKNEDETDYGANFKSNTTNTSTFSFGCKRTPTATSSISSGPTTSLKDDSAPEKQPFQFTFGLKNAQFGNTENSSFSKPFSFASAPVDKTAPAESSDENAPEYVPPKNDFVPVKEEDAFYSKRCKLFFKKDDSYVERGIGTLHLKPADSKTQLLIRAETSLGNILLNILLNDSLPMSKTGKNNILLVCVPNPPLDAKKADSKEAIPMLIKVKTSEDADELLEILNKHKS